MCSVVWILTICNYVLCLLISIGHWMLYCARFDVCVMLRVCELFVFVSYYNLVL